MIPRPICKVVLLGKESTGKSCLVRRFTENEYDPTFFASTVGASYAAKKVDTSQGEIVISVWDTAGQERFDSMTRLYYNGASAALVCIDLTDSSSFSKAQFWVKELKKNQPSCSCYIVVTKSDLLNPPANTTASSMGPIPRVPACLSTAIKESPIVEGNEGSQPGVDNLQKGLRALNPTSSSPTSPFGQTAKSTNSPTSPFDRESSSDTQDRTTTADESTTSSSWKSAASSGPSVSSLPKRKKEVADSQLSSLAQSMNAKICRTSSATGEGISELFNRVAEDLAPKLAREQSNAEAVILGQNRSSADRQEPSALPGNGSLSGEHGPQQSGGQWKKGRQACCY